MQHLPAELWKWDAVDLARGIRTGAIGAREATEACLARLEAVNPAINAMAQVTAETARAEADAADAAVRRGEAMGLLHGVPLTTKINVDFAGLPNTNGCHWPTTWRRRTAPWWPTCAAPARSSSAAPTRRRCPCAGSPRMRCTAAR